MRTHPPLLPLNGGYDMAKMIRLGMALSLTLFVVAFLAGAGIVAAQNGPPQFPHAFYGSVKYYSTPGGPYTNAPVDTVVTAKVNGDVKGQITVTEAGMYGGEGPGDLKLTVQGQVCSGCVIEFWVDDKLTQEVRVQYDPGGPWYEVLPEWEVGFDSGEVWGLNLIYSMPSTIGYSPTSLNFSATEGEANPSSRTLSIWNSAVDPGAMAWSVTDNATWLSLAPTGGTSSGEHDAVTVSVNISGLTADGYSADITIGAAGATNTPRTVPVSLTIALPPKPSPSPSPSPSPALGPGVTPAGPTPVVPEVSPTPGPGVVRSIEVTPESASIEVGETHQFTATATYFGGITDDVTDEAAWASSNTAVATVDAGLATGAGEGITRITATFQGISDRATLNVSVVLESIVVTPASAEIDVDQTYQFTATATYSGGSTADVTAEADWASSDEDVATVVAGLATGVGAGTIEITATLAGVASSPATLEVTALPLAIPWWIIGLIIGLLLLLALLLLLRRQMRRGEEAAA